MKRFNPTETARVIAEKRAAAVPHQSGIRSIAAAVEDADDRRYLDRMPLWHRLVVRMFSRHFILFARSAIAAAADRQTLSFAQAKTLARSIELRTRQGEE